MDDNFRVKRCALDKCDEDMPELVKGMDLNYTNDRIVTTTAELIKNDGKIRKAADTVLSRLFEMPEWEPFFPDNFKAAS
jgi:hypothetical protein